MAADSLLGCIACVGTGYYLVNAGHGFNLAAWRLSPIRMCLVSSMMLVSLLQQWVCVARAATVSHGVQSWVRVITFLLW